MKKFFKRIEEKIDKKATQIAKDFEKVQYKLSNLNDNKNALLKIGDYKNTTLKERFQIITAKDKYKKYSNSFKETKYLLEGDIISISRGSYDHYGIYIGNNKVIHFTSMDSDISLENNQIMLTNMDHFMKGKTKFFKVNVELIKQFNNQTIDIILNLIKIYGNNNSSMIDLINKTLELEIYPREETIERAKSLLGYKGYSLPFDNCEHFAWWCKT